MAGGSYSLKKLIFELSKLPGVGEKSAARLAYHITKQPLAAAEALCDAILTVKRTMQMCQHCFTFSDAPLCAICHDATRNRSLVCVVEKPSDIYSIEKMHKFNGLYHVLHGVIAPLEGINPEALKIEPLVERVQTSDPPCREVIFALNPSVEGQATIMFLTRLLKPYPVKLSQLAYGLAMGSTLEYSDSQTIERAFSNRVSL